MKVHSAVYRYVEQRTRQGRFRGRTPRTVELCLVLFANHTGDIDTAQLTKSHAEGWLEDQYSQVSASTLHGRFSMLRAFFVWMERERLVKSNPFHEMDPPRKPNNLPRSLTKEQVEKLFANLPDIRAELICSLMVQSGLRAAEVASLEVGNIDFTRWVAIVTGKGQKQRLVPIFEETRPLLLSYLASFPARTGPLIRSYIIPTQGLTPHRIVEMVSQWMYDAGIKSHARDGVSGHALRHTCATDMLVGDEERGPANLRAIQELLGHSSLAVTQTYLRVNTSDLWKAGEGRKYRR